jgi:hypothetical protein
MKKANSEVNEVGISQLFVFKMISILTVLFEVNVLLKSLLGLSTYLINSEVTTKNDEELSNKTINLQQQQK